MAARGKVLPVFEGRSVQGSGMMRHGPFPGLSSAAAHRPLESLPPPHLLEHKIAAQEAEIKQLAGDNHRLASTHVALRDALVSATQDLQKLKSHIRSIHTESDIQIRVLLDKIAKMEVDIRAGDTVKKNLQQVHIEAQSLAASRQELSAQIQRATQELRKAHGDVKNMPDLQAELDSLVQEHQRLRATFEYEKNKNGELVDQMKAKEKDLIAMAKEVEMLRAEILNAEKRGNAPNLFGAATPVDSNGPFVDAYGRAHGHVGESMVPYVDSNGVAAVNSAGGGSAVWPGP
ncbi:protein FLX-like 4 [Gastrolobium bilobum]|uniref:protein FLX-like 4 n=1 Tax=Gastrolobium bilobum TaxID=150636 RepID=UPI002AB25796|nr:protein FLX-like 4 [Gastrolobium bilobum]